MQQPSSSRSQRPVGIFRTLPLSEISQTYAWFEERRANAPVFQDEHMPFPLWQVFRYEDVLTVLNDYNRFSSQALRRIRPTIANYATSSIKHLHRARWRVSQIASPR